MVLEFDNIENIKRAVEISAGAAILPEPSVAKEVRAGSLVAVGIDGQEPKHRLTRPLAIIHRRHDKLDLTASRFLDLLMDRGAKPAAGDEIPADKRLAAASPS